MWPILAPAFKILILQTLLFSIAGLREAAPQPFGIEDTSHSISITCGSREGMNLHRKCGRTDLSAARQRRLQVRILEKLRESPTWTMTRMDFHKEKPG